MRIFYNDTEITKQVDRLDTTEYALTYSTGNYLYIASDFPLNHFYLKLGTIVNLISTSMTVKYWSAEWISAIELRDETNALSSSGFVEFTPNQDNYWVRAPKSTEVGMSTMLYDKFWIRISFANSLTASIALSFFGNKFSDDTDLYDEYPVFNDSNFLTSFKSGKTTWEEQHIKAADQIISDLKRKNVIFGPEQILERKLFAGASVCKCAEIIFTAFGNDYIEQRKIAKEEYTKRLDLKQFSIDTNNDGILEPIEKRSRQGWISR